jgi:hypothetical protein
MTRFADFRRRINAARRMARSWATAGAWMAWRYFKQIEDIVHGFTRLRQLRFLRRVSRAWRRQTVQRSRLRGAFVLRLERSCKRKFLHAWHIIAAQRAWAERQGALVAAASACYTLRRALGDLWYEAYVERMLDRFADAAFARRNGLLRWRCWAVVHKRRRRLGHELATKYRLASHRECLDVWLGALAEARRVRAAERCRLVRFFRRRWRHGFCRRARVVFKAREILRRVQSRRVAGVLARLKARVLSAERLRVCSMMHLSGFLRRWLAHTSRRKAFKVCEGPSGDKRRLSNP